MTVKGVGTDILDVERIKSAMARHPKKFVEKILSPVELAEFATFSGREPERFVAKRFAIKEAVSKALGTGLAQGVDWGQMTLLHLETGQPYVELTGVALQRMEAIHGQKLDVSLSDEGNQILAFAVIS